MPFSGALLSGAVAAVLHALLAGLLAGLVAPLSAYLLHTPDLAAQPALRALWATSLAILLALAAALVALAATAAITGSAAGAGGGRAAQAARSALGARLATGLLTASLALPLLALEARLANLIVTAFLPGGAPGLAASPLLAGVRAALATGSGGSLADLAVAAVAVALLAVLAALALTRWATLWLLVVLAPLVMAVGILPAGASLVRLWWRLQLTAVFLPVTQAVAVAGFGAMFAAPGAAPGVASAPGAGAGLGPALAGVALLALLTRLPAWAAGSALHLSGRDLTAPVQRALLMTGRVAALTRSRPPAAPAIPVSEEEL